jgi:hypothetical protein
MRLLLTFSDWHTGRTQASHGDPGPIRRLLAVGGVAYDEVRLFAVKRDRPAARALAAELGHGGVLAEVSTLDVTDPSDYAQLFHALSGVPARLPPDAEVDVLLSSGTPQAQTIWVVLVKAGLLRARLLQVIPPQFVPDPHPEPVREVRLDFDGFPEIRALREEVVRLRARVRAVSGRLVGESEALRRVAEGIARLAPTPLPVLITGETGTGKELVARALHDASTRADGPFIAENCGALAEGVLQSELFGHEAGAFTGAAKRRRGLFEQAAGGTLFLDEVGELPARVQVQLLRVLQEGVLRRVGGDEAVPVDARIVAATHRDLPAMVAAGTFREDLYYRPERCDVARAAAARPPRRSRTPRRALPFGDGRCSPASDAGGVGGLEGLAMAGQRPRTAGRGRALDRLLRRSRRRRRSVDPARVGAARGRWTAGTDRRVIPGGRRRAEGSTVDPRKHERRARNARRTRLSGGACGHRRRPRRHEREPERRRAAARD